MSFFKISESFQDTANKIINLINAHLDYYKIVAFDKVVVILSKTVSSAILGVTGFMMVFFGSFALAAFLGELLSHPSAGYLIVSGLYGLFGIIIWKNRVKWIVDPMIEGLSELIEETSEDLGMVDEMMDGLDDEETLSEENN